MIVGLNWKHRKILMSLYLGFFNGTTLFLQAEPCIPFLFSGCEMAQSLISGSSFRWFFELPIGLQLGLLVCLQLPHRFWQFISVRDGCYQYPQTIICFYLESRKSFVSSIPTGSFWTPRKWVLIYKGSKDRHSFIDDITPIPGLEGNWNSCSSRKARMRVMTDPAPGQRLLMQLAGQNFTQVLWLLVFCLALQLESMVAFIFGGMFW